MASTATKVFLGIGCVTLALFGASLATCASCMALIGHSARSTAPPTAGGSLQPITPAEDASFRRVRGQGMMDFVAVSKELGADHAALEHRVRNFCNQRHGVAAYCWVLVWPKQSLVPKSLPMSDKQQRRMLASYIRNPNTGHDCFQLIRNGDEYYHSGECGPHADSPSDPRHDPIP